MNTSTRTFIEKKGKMARLLKDRYLWLIVALTVVLGILAYENEINTLGWLAAFHEEWKMTYMASMHILFLATVAIAAWRFGVRWGLATSFALGILIFSHAFEMAEYSGQPDIFPETSIIFALGVLLSWLIGSYEKGRLLQKAHTQLEQELHERKQMEEKLIMTDRLASIGEMAAGVAHELNNPLTGVIGFAELLLEKDVPDDIREDIAIIHHEAKRVAEVVKNLLTFARRHPPSKQPVDINTVIAGVLGLRAYEQKVSNIQVVTHFAPDLPEVVADHFQLQQVFFNIITNAEYFMTEAHHKGTLTITTERVGDVIRASFADDGMGISKENLGHLFDPFFTTKEVGRGTGLGLSICHGIITEHGGRIYAESELGKGTTFVVELPITIAKEGAVK